VVADGSQPIKSFQKIQEKWKTRSFENGFVTMATKKRNKF
jgi:hypothetical protein